MFDRRSIVRMLRFVKPEVDGLPGVMGFEASRRLQPNGLGKPRRPSLADPTTFADKHDRKRSPFSRRQGRRRLDPMLGGL